MLTWFISTTNPTGVLNGKTAKLYILHGHKAKYTGERPHKSLQLCYGSAGSLMAVQSSSDLYRLGVILGHVCLSVEH